MRAPKKMKNKVKTLLNLIKPTKNLYQCRNKLLLKNFLFPILKENQFKSFLILFLRFFSFGKLCNLKGSEKNLKFHIDENSKYFILDLREAVINFHQFLLLTQFFSFLSKQYQVFEIWVDDNSFRYNEYKDFVKEIYDILNYLSKLYNFQIFRKNKSQIYYENSSFLKISYTEGYYYKNKPFSNNEIIYDFFIKELNFKSSPIEYSLDQSIEKKFFEIKSLRNVLQKNFTIIFYATFDKFLKYEKKSRAYGVISKENFKMMENIYFDLLKIIENKNINNIKIVLFNKKSLNWPINDHCIDLRNFENYNLDFPNILGLLNDNCKWTIGSEGTIGYSLVMCSKLKHALFVDSSHWPGTVNSNNTVPLFYYDRDEIEYKNKPYQYVPISKDEVLNKIFKDYEKFCNTKENIN